jgi:hypothetical protein
LLDSTTTEKLRNLSLTTYHGPGWVAGFLSSALVVRSSHQGLQTKKSQDAKAVPSLKSKTKTTPERRFDPDMTLTLTKALDINNSPSARLKAAATRHCVAASGVANPAYKRGAAGYNGARISKLILALIHEERKRGRPWRR